jgi:hypothetical protein
MDICERRQHRWPVLGDQRRKEKREKEAALAKTKSLRAPKKTDKGPSIG